MTRRPTADIVLMARGQPASPGQHLGPARIVRELGALEGAGPGDVVVLATATPAATTIIARAGAIVTVEGGVLSNLAVVARELGIPCVVGVPRAVDAFLDGDELFVDADAGLVSLIVPAPGFSRQRLYRPG